MSIGRQYLRSSLLFGTVVALPVGGLIFPGLGTTQTPPIVLMGGGTQP